MFIDNELAIVSGVAIDLGVSAPSSGQPIKCFARGITLDLLVQSGATDSVADTTTEFESLNGEDLEFSLPSNTGRWVAFNFLDGSIDIVLPGNPTNP